MSLYGLTALSVFAGFGLDCLLGDPLSAAHPVVLMGKLISFLEKKLRSRFPKTWCPWSAPARAFCCCILLGGSIPGPTSL